MRGIVVIIIGIIFIIGGLSGHLARIFATDRDLDPDVKIYSRFASAVVGVLLIGLGIFRMVRR